MFSFLHNEDRVNAWIDVLFPTQREPSGGGGHSHTLPIRVCAAQRGRDFEASDLERAILAKIFSRTGCQFGVPGATYPPKKYPSAPPPPPSWIDRTRWQRAF